MSDQVCTISGKHKGLSYITYFKYNKKVHYASTCTKLRKNPDVSND